jgi:hypothetical protein
MFEYDSPWKEVLERYFPKFRRFCRWERGYEFLDKELEKVVRMRSWASGW